MDNPTPTKSTDASLTRQEYIGVKYLQKHFYPESILAEGYLTKIGSFWKSQKRRWFVVTFQDIKYYENKDAFHNGKAPYGTILVKDIQSVSTSDALNFGPNTSLQIRTRNRTLELGDQKENVADSIFFALQRYIAKRDAPSSNPSAIAELTIPVVEMPSIMQKEVMKQFAGDPSGRQYMLLDDPPGMFSWIPDIRCELYEEHKLVFEKVFGADPANREKDFESYVLLHGRLNYEMAIYYNANGQLRRVLYDPEPLLHYLRDNWKQIKICHFSWFDEVHGLELIVDALKQLKIDFGFVLHEFEVPTKASSLDSISNFIHQIHDVMPPNEVKTGNIVKIDNSPSKALNQSYVLSDHSVPADQIPLSSVSLKLRLVHEPHQTPPGSQNIHVENPSEPKPLANESREDLTHEENETSFETPPGGSSPPSSEGIIPPCEKEPSDNNALNYETSVSSSDLNEAKDGQLES